MTKQQAKAIEAVSAFVWSVSRSACLQQECGGKCICFACEANRLLAKYGYSLYLTPRARDLTNDPPQSIGELRADVESLNQPKETTPAAANSFGAASPL